jgi:16S rRNA (cytosine967-C5)-methyltransferase
MHPKALLDACADLVRLVLQFEHPADAVVSRYFREHRAVGPRERATLAETAFAVLRKKLLFEQLARSGSGAKERKLAILGFFGPRDFLASALNDTEKQWLATCDAIPADALMAPHRHNLPEWMAQALQAQLGDDFWVLAEHLHTRVPFQDNVALTSHRGQPNRASGHPATRRETWFVR